MGSRIIPILSVSSLPVVPSPRTHFNAITRWNVATVLILLNILISLFSTAYDDASIFPASSSDVLLIVIQVVEDAAAEYLAYFADKTVAMVRAPDEYTYPAPFNLIELALVGPLQLVGLTVHPQCRSPSPSRFYIRKETYDKASTHYPDTLPCANCDSCAAEPFPHVRSVHRPAHDHRALRSTA